MQERISANNIILPKNEGDNCMTVNNWLSVLEESAGINVYALCVLITHDTESKEYAQLFIRDYYEV